MVNDIKKVYPRLALYKGAKHASNILLAQEYRRRRRGTSAYDLYAGITDAVSGSIALALVNLSTHYKKHKNLNDLIIRGLGKKTLQDLSDILSQGPLKKKTGRVTIDEMIF